MFIFQQLIDCMANHKHHLVGIVYGDVCALWTAILRLCNGSTVRHQLRYLQSLVMMKKGASEPLSDFTERYMELATKINSPSVPASCRVGMELVVHALLAACQDDPTLSADVRELRQEHMKGKQLTLKGVITVFSLSHETKPQALPRAFMGNSIKAGYCFKYQDGECTRTDCRFRHEIDANYSRASGGRGGRGADSGRGRGGGAARGNGGRGADGGRGRGGGAARGAGGGRGRGHGEPCIICGGVSHPYSRCEKFRRWQQDGFPECKDDGGKDDGGDSPDDPPEGNLAIMPGVDFMYGFDYAALRRGSSALDSPL